jgi:hypothetical protein
MISFRVNLLKVRKIVKRSIQNLFNDYLIIKRWIFTEAKLAGSFDFRPKSVAEGDVLN